MFAIRADLLLRWSLVIFGGLGVSWPLAAASPPQLDDGLDFLVDHWLQAEGLPQASVWTITQDHEGYFWLGTEEGLARFDGQRFTVFDTSNTPALNGNWIRGSYLDSAGTLWVTNYSGDLLRYSDKTFRRPVGWPSEPTQEEVHALVPHPEGGFWLGTDGGLRWLDDEEQLHVPALAGLDRIRILALAEDAAGSLWLGTSEGLHVLRHGRPTEEHYVTDRVVTALHVAAGGRLWIGTETGLLLLDRTGGEPSEALPPLLRPLAGLQIFNFLEDHAGKLWIGTDQGLFAIRLDAFEPGETLEGAVLEHFPAPEILPDRHIKALFEDADQNLWIGARYGGLVRFRPRHIERVGTPEGLIDDLVWSVFEDRDGTLWITTDGGLARLGSDGRLEHFTTADGLPANDVGALHQDHEGTLWIGTFGDGLVSRREGQFRVETSMPSFRAKIRCFFEDDQNRLWVGTDDGLVRRDPTGDRAFGVAEGLPHSTIRGLHQDASGVLWVATLAGLARYHEDRSKPFEPVAQPFPGRPKSLLGDPDGTLWIGTWDDGLVRYRDGRIHVYGVADGLFDRRIHRIIDDREGGLWMSSNHGIFRVRREELEAHATGQLDRITSVVLDEADGMRNSECNGASQPAGWLANDGRLWFATLKGVVAVDRRALGAHAGPLQPVIEELLVDQEAYPVVGRPVLPPRSKTVALRYTAPLFDRATDTGFRYRLVGFDNGWVDAGNERRVHYTNLPPGDYRFEVMARRGGGAWGPNIASLELEHRPAFTQTPLFWGLSLVLVGLLGWGLYRLRVHRLLTTNLELEGIRRELEEKNAMIRAQNAELEGFTYTVSHDLKNPLFTIEGFLGFLEQDLERDPERAAANLERVRGAARKMRHLLDELLELSRIGRLTRPEEAIELKELVLEALALLEGELVEQGTRVVVSPDLPVVWGDHTRLLQVFQNLASNAIKYMGEQSQPMIEIGASRQGDEVLCHVRDNGCGIEPAYRDRVFQLFEQLDPSHEGTGVGLAIVQRVIEHHGGRIWVESEGAGQGSTFYFTLPAVPTASETG